MLGVKRSHSEDGRGVAASASKRPKQEPNSEARGARITVPPRDPWDFAAGIAALRVHGSPTAPPMTQSVPREESPLRPPWADLRVRENLAEAAEREDVARLASQARRANLDADVVARILVQAGRDVMPDAMAWLLDAHCGAEIDKTALHQLAARQGLVGLLPEDPRTLREAARQCLVAEAVPRGRVAVLAYLGVEVGMLSPAARRQFLRQANRLGNAAGVELLLATREHARHDTDDGYPWDMR